MECLLDSENCTLYVGDNWLQFSKHGPSGQPCVIMHDLLEDMICGILCDDEKGFCKSVTDGRTMDLPTERPRTDRPDDGQTL